jgi:hypothetical protein
MANQLEGESEGVGPLAACSPQGARWRTGLIATLIPSTQNVDTKLDPLRTARNRMRGRPFKKVESGNPGGRPKVIAELRALARAWRSRRVFR